MDLRLIAMVLSRITLICTIFFLLPLLVAGVGHGPDWWAFAVSFLLGGLCSVMLSAWGRSVDKILTVREALVVTGLGWLLLAGLGMLPYLLGTSMTIMDAAFESVSGFSGTGATVLPSLDNLPRGILFWRCLTHWIGGFLIVLVLSTLLPQVGCGADLYGADMMGLASGRGFPQVRKHGRAIFCVYILLTVAATLTYMVCGLDVIDAAGHAFSTVSTGGFSMYDGNVGVFDNVALEAAMVFFMLAASGNFELYRLVYKRGWRVLKKNTEFKAYLGLLLTAIAFILLDLLWHTDLPWLEAVRYTVFQVVSISSTTGFFSTAFTDWPPFSQGVLLLLMLIGGCAGSSAGGLRMARVVLLGRLIYWVARQKLYPQSAVRVYMNGSPIPEMALFSVGRFFFVYIFFVVFWSLLLVVDGVSLLDSLAISASSMSGVGQAVGIASPAADYAALPDVSKFIACMAMLFGRLEIFAFLVLFWPEFWNRTKGW